MAPSTPLPVTTSYTQTDTHVKIAWSAPSDNNSPITSYTIKIRNNAGTNSYTSASCDGSSATVISNRYCEIPLTELVDGSGNYALVHNKLVAAEVLATNAFGSSSYSTYNTVGALIKTVPLKPPTAVQAGSGTSYY